MSHVSAMHVEPTGGMSREDRGGISIAARGQPDIRPCNIKPIVRSFCLQRGSCMLSKCRLVCHYCAPKPPAQSLRKPDAGTHAAHHGVDLDDGSDLAEELLIGFEDGAARVQSLSRLSGYQVPTNVCRKLSCWVWLRSFGSGLGLATRL